jgi:hypothetical protein
MELETDAVLNALPRELHRLLERQWALAMARVSRKPCRCLRSLIINCKFRKVSFDSPTFLCFVFLFC